MGDSYVAGPGSMPSQVGSDHGVMCVSPSYTQVTGDAAFALTSANHKIAVLFTPEVNFDPSGKLLSWYLTATTTAGNVGLSVYDVTMGYEPNGALTGTTASQPTMSANNAPAGYVVALKDKTNTDAEASGTYAAWKAMDGSASSDARSNAAPSGTDPINYLLTVPAGKRFNKVRIKSAGDAYPSDGVVYGSTADVGAVPTVANYDGWTQIGTFAGVTDPGANGARDINCTNAVNFNHLCIKTTGRTGSSAYVAFREIELYEAPIVPVPGTLLHSYGNDDTTGASADTWIGKTLDSFQFQRGKCYSIVLSGSASLNVSASKRRWIGTKGSMFPDGFSCMETTDGGTTWTQSQQDSKPAMLNFVLGATANHAPHLIYGQKYGKHAYLPNDGFAEIPDAAVWLNCEALPAITSRAQQAYNVYLFRTANVLTLEANLTDRVMSEGIQVKSGATDHRWLGIVGPIVRVGAAVGPIDAPDQVRIAYRGMIRSMKKSCPYASQTQQTVPDYTHGWVRWGQSGTAGMLSTDFEIEFLALAGSKIEWESRTQAYGYLVCGALVDDAIMERVGFGSDRINIWMERRHNFQLPVGEGLHTVVPAVKSVFNGSEGAGIFLNFWNEGVGDSWTRAQVDGELKCL